MPQLISDIALIHDTTVKVEDVGSPLAKCFSLQSRSLDDYIADSSVSADLSVFFVNPRLEKTHGLLKTALELCDGDKIFVLPTHSSDGISGLYDLGVEDYVVLPIEAHKLRTLAKKTISRRIERSWSALDPAMQKALKTSIKCFEKCFSLVKQGQPLPMKDIQASCHHIREAAELGGLNDWINALDRHHNYSFRHSMFVCGSLTYFAHAIGIRGADLEILTIGGLLHDIGKSEVPLEILDKPGKLDDQEWKIMQKHPEYSREILLREQNLDQNVISMAVEHHEKLDGTGYPDGLSGAKIDDYIRMTTIADVYSALIDKRAYKGGMGNVEALELMEKFEGHLDMDLFRAFKSFVLD